MEYAEILKEHTLLKNDLADLPLYRIATFSNVIIEQLNEILEHSLFKE